MHNVNDDYLRFDVLGGLRGYYGNIGDWNIAFRLAQELLALAKKIADMSRLVRAYNGLGNAYLHRGEFLSSIRCFQQVIQIEKALDTTIQHDVVGNIRLAEVLWLLGYSTQAQQVATEVLGQVDEKKAPFWPNSCTRVYVVHLSTTWRRNNDATIGERTERVV